MKRKDIQFSIIDWSTSYILLEDKGKGLNLNVIWPESFFSPRFSPLYLAWFSYFGRWLFPLCVQSFLKNRFSGVFTFYLLWLCPRIINQEQLQVRWSKECSFLCLTLLLELLLNLFISFDLFLLIWGTSTFLPHASKWRNVSRALPSSLHLFLKVSVPSQKGHPSISRIF